MIGFVACAPPPKALAQFIGYTSPQTEQQTLATNLLCTGAAQTFAIQNLGQTQHYLNIANVTGATKFQAEIDGIDRQGNVLRISDILEPSNTGSQFSSGSLYGAGYFPKVQVQITCSPNTATFTASYSGAWATYNGNAGAYLAAQIDKVTFSSADATVTETDTVQTPFGSSGGTIFFKYNTSSGALGTLKVQCSTVTGFGGSISTLVAPALQVTLANTTTGQSFQVPDTGCPFATVTYAPNGGGGANTIQTEYVFAQPGASAHASTDPCQSGTFPKTSAAVFAGAATTTQQVALSLGQSIYVCGYQLSQVATAGTVQWVYGTGVNCGTGTTTLTGAMGVTASQPFSYGVGDATIMKAPTGQELCITTTGAGGTVSGIVTFIQAP
jgi:hypothetical protein